MKKGNKKSLLRGAVALCAAALLSLSSFTPAAAQTIGGGNGGVGGLEGNALFFYWKAHNGPNAWTSFSQNKGFPPYYESGMNFGWNAIQMSATDRELCTRSSTIWYVEDSRTPNWWQSRAYWGLDNANTIYKFAFGGHDITNPVMSSGNLAEAQKYNAAIAEWNAGRTQNEKSSTTVVCSAGLGEMTRTYPQKDYKSDSKSGVVKGVYSINTTIEPQFASNRPLEAQTGVPKKTEFGKLVDKYFTVKIDPATKTYTLTPRGNTVTPADLEAQANAAKAADASMDHVRLDLSQKNKDGMADGGVLNVNEFQQETSITTKQNDGYERGRTCTEVSRDGGYSWSLQSCDPWSAWVKTSSTLDTPSASLPIQKQTGFWQMVAVHCNDEGFATLASKAGVVVTSTGDPTQKLAAAANSKKYNKQPAVLDFGQPGTPSATRGFYDKECPFDCTPAPTGTDATAANGATTNLGNAAPAPDGVVEKYGASSGKSTNNKFQFFRDNKPNPVKLDVWYPKDNAVVDYQGTAPISTTITRWALGTPGIDADSGGKFTFKTASGQEVFSKNGNIKDQKNWDPATGYAGSDFQFTSSTAAMFKGLVRDFTAQATWATDEITLNSGKKVLASQVLNFKWEYDPLVSNRIPTQGVGFGVGSAQAIGAINTVAAPIQGKCYAQFGQTTSEDVAKLVLDNTGTGTKNNLDTQLLNYDAAQGPTDSPNNLFITFVRSTGE